MCRRLKIRGHAPLEPYNIILFAIFFVCSIIIRDRETASNKRRLSWFLENKKLRKVLYRKIFSTKFYEAYVKFITRKVLNVRYNI